MRLDTSFAGCPSVADGCKSSRSVPLDYNMQKRIKTRNEASPSLLCICVCIWPRYAETICLNNKCPARLYLPTESREFRKNSSKILVRQSIRARIYIYIYIYIYKRRRSQNIAPDSYLTRKVCIHAPKTGSHSYQPSSLLRIYQV